MPERRRRADRYDDFCAEPVREPQPAEVEDVRINTEQQAPLPYGVLATNTGVRLACTMAAMIGLFALFLCWAEKESRVIRRFAVQSAALTGVHALAGAAALMIGAVLGGVPYLGLIVSLMCWLFYIAVVILLIVTRVRLMQRAWQGMRFHMPSPIERLLMRFY